MATVNLGRIKPVFRGAYAGRTAYVVDDIVTHGDETFICIQAGTGNATSNASYWTKLAAKGADGTNVATTLTTQGDILYRDGSGLQRLGAGTSGYFLKTQGTGANPVWAESSGGVIQTKFFETGVAFTQSNSSFTNLGSFAVTITPTSASNKILVMVSIGAIDSAGNTSSFRFTRNDTDVGIGDVNGNRQRTSFTIQGTSYTATNHPYGLMHSFIDTPNSTSALTYKIKCATEAGSAVYVNRGRDDGNDGSIYYPQAHSTFIAQEIVA